MSNLQYFHWTGKNREELLSFAGEAISFGEAGTPVIESMGEHGCLESDDVIAKGADGSLGIIGPRVAIKEAAEGGILALEKHWNKEERENAPKSDWAVPHKQKLRIDDEKHVRLAWDMVDRTKDLSEEERASARRRILAKAHKFGIDTSSWNKMSISKEDIEATLVEFDREDAPVVILPPATDVFTHLLCHIGEEASEVTWAAMKAKRYGLETLCPDAGITNRQKLIKELAEVQACINLLNDELIGAGQPPIEVDEAAIQQATAERVETLQKEFDLGRFTLPAAAPAE